MTIFQGRLKRGDIIHVEDSRGNTAQGPITSVSNEGTLEEPNWYIEMNSPQGPRYLKQTSDRITVITLVKEA
jgi:hypothetical protein